MAVIAIHQCSGLKTRRQRLPDEGSAAIAVQPAMQRRDVNIGAGWQEEGPFRFRAAAGLLQHALLPVQKDLVVFENLVVADVLQPARTQSDQQPRDRGLELKGEAGEQAAFPPADRHGVDHGEDACESLRGEVVPHQLWSIECGGLGTELSSAWPLLPEGLKPVLSFAGDQRLNR